MAKMRAVQVARAGGPLDSSSAKCPSRRGPNSTTPFRPADGSRGESALGHGPALLRAEANDR